MKIDLCPTRPIKQIKQVLCVAVCEETPANEHAFKHKSKETKDSLFNVKADKFLAELDDALQGGLSLHAARMRFKAKAHTALVLPVTHALACDAIVLIGCGKQSAYTRDADRACAAEAVRQAQALHATEAVLVPFLATTHHLDWALRVQDFTYAATLATYRFERYRTQDRDENPVLSKLSIMIEPALYEHHQHQHKHATESGQHLAEAVMRARDLVNEPANVLYPESFANLAKEWSKKPRLSAKF